MALDEGTVALIVGTFSVLGFSVSFGVPTVVGAAELLRPKRQVEIIPGQRPKLHGFPQRVVIILSRDWPRFFYVVSVLFFISGSLDLAFVCASSVGFEGQFVGVLTIAAFVCFWNVCALAAGWVWLLICAARYSPDEVQDIVDEATKVATVSEYVEAGARTVKKKGAGKPDVPKKKGKA